MNKVYFEQKHLEALERGISNCVMQNIKFNAKLGQIMSVEDLIHNTTINTLREMRSIIKKKIDELEGNNYDSWTKNNNEVGKLEMLKFKFNLIHLIIGYKLHISYTKEIESKKRELQKEINNLIEGGKTPEKKIEELKKELEELDK